MENNAATKMRLGTLENFNNAQMEQSVVEWQWKKKSRSLSEFSVTKFPLFPNQPVCCLPAISHTLIHIYYWLEVGRLPTIPTIWAYSYSQTKVTNLYIYLLSIYSLYHHRVEHPHTYFIQSQFTSRRSYVHSVTTFVIGLLNIVHLVTHSTVFRVFNIYLFISSSFFPIDC